MEQRRPMTEQERMRRRAQIRRKKKKRLIRKIKHMFYSFLFLIFLLVGAWLIFTNFIVKPKYEMEKPMQRTEAEVREKLEEMAKKYKGFEDIIEHYEDYPEVYRAALANNPEMLEYVKGLSEDRTSATATLTKKRSPRNILCFCSGTSVGDMRLMALAALESPGVGRLACRWLSML